MNLPESDSAWKKPHQPGSSAAVIPVEKRRLADWLMPSLGDALFLYFFFKALSAGGRLLNDGDTGWHIVTGENILQTFRIPYADPYSHTLPGTPWTAHEWLAEVIFAGIHRWMGLNGVVLLSVTVIIATFFFLYRFLIYRKVSPLIAAFFTMIAIWTSMLHWLARPHVFSFPLTLAFFVILELYQRERLNYLKLLPPLMVLWVNLHGGYILGLILIGLYAGGNLMILLFMQERRDGAKKAVRALGLTALATLLATFINPQGPAILYFPFHLVGRQFIMDNVKEWLSPDFHKNPIFEFTLLLFLATLVLSKKKPDIFEGSLALLLIHMSLYSSRYIPLMAILITPMVAVRFAEVLDRLTEYAASYKSVGEMKSIFRSMSADTASLEARFNRHLWVYVAVAVCFLVAVNGGQIGKRQALDYRHNEERFPVKALEFAQANGITGNVFNNDGWGGYIIYKSYPQYRVFMDGRSDMYGVPFMKEYLKVAKAQLDYEEILDRYHVTWMIFNANSPICQLLAASGKWKLVYADTTANILLKDLPQNRGLIEKYKDVTFVAAPPEDEKP